MNDESLLTRFDEMVKRFRQEFSEIVESERAKIKAEVEAYNAEKQRIEAVNVNDDDLIDLNVGGTKFTTTGSTLCQVQDSLLAAMFSGRWEDNIKRDKDGAVFFDFNPQHFILILDYLRVKKIETSENPPPLPKVPENQTESFNSLVQYLGLSNEISASFKTTPSEKFNCCSSGFTLEEGGQVAVHNQTTAHEYVLGENLYSHGTVNLKLKLESFCWKCCVVATLFTNHTYFLYKFNSIPNHNHMPSTALDVYAQRSHMHTIPNLSTYKYILTIISLACK